MHRHKMVAQVILILSVVNFVLAAPAVREIHEARDDVAVRVLAEDVGAVVEKRFKIFPSFFGTPMTRWEDSDWDSSDDGYETAPDEPSDHSSTSTEQQPAPPTPSQKRPKIRRPKIMTPDKIKATKIVAGVGLLTVALLGIVDIQVSQNNSSAS
jgi:hypothetical protein